MKIVPISRITVNRGERQRKELTGLEELADSIERHTSALPDTGGLIHPIVVTRDLVLVAGERRFTACRDVLRRTEIAVTFTDEVPLQTLRSLELEENIKRLDIPWKDTALAIKEFHEIRSSEDDDWSVSDSAQSLGLSENHVYRNICLAKEILSGNSKIIEAPKFSVARGIMERESERKAEVAKEELRSVLYSKAPALAPKPVVTESANAIVNTSFVEWARSYDGPRFNFIHCDFPYGINAGEFNQGGAKAFGGYEDSEETYWSLVDCLLDNLDRVAGESCHILFWFSMKFYQPTLERLSTAFTIDPFPLIWSKTDNVGILPDPSRGPRRIYETAFHGYRGDRKVVQAVSNWYGAASSREIHMSEKPVPMLRHFFRMYIDGTSRVLDPTAGSGGALRAADSLGAAHVLGLEINPEYAVLANKAFDRDRNLRRAAEIVK